MLGGKFMRLVTLFIIAVFLSSCAKSPSSIPPAAVASSEYDHLDCQGLSSELALANSRLEAASDKQNSAQAADAFSVFLVLVPVSALAGDSEADVARYTGETQALERAIERRC